MTATKHKTRAIKVGFKSFIRILNGFEGSLCHFFKLGAWRSAKPGACLLRFSALNLRPRLRLLLGTNLLITRRWLQWRFFFFFSNFENSQKIEEKSYDYNFSSVRLEENRHFLRIKGTSTASEKWGKQRVLFLGPGFKFFAPRTFLFFFRTLHDLNKELWIKW